MPQKSDRVERERQVPLFDAPKSSELPALSLLDEPGPREQSYSDEALEAMSRLVEIKLRDFGVEVEVVAVLPGPVITRFELRPAPGVKVSQISNLVQGSRARAVRHQRAGGGNHSRQVGGRVWRSPTRSARS